MIALLRRLFAAKPQRHYPDGAIKLAQRVCKCGHHSAWDYDLRRHFEETGRIGK